MNVAIVKYNAGNIQSVINALKRLGVEPQLSDDPEVLLKSDRVLFPGQGEAGTTMSYLRAHHLDTVIPSLRQPVLGICVGMQLMCRYSEENDTDCLGIFPTEVKRFQPTAHEQKVPQMGWNTIERLKSPLFRHIDDGEFVYFIHSYYVPENTYGRATTDYITPYCSALHKDNFYATQFHPEKSGRIGEQILKNFLEIETTCE